MTLVVAVDTMLIVGKKQEAERDKRMRALPSPAVLRTPHERVNWFRVKRGLGCNELGRLAGVTDGVISRYELGKRTGVKGKTFAALAEALGVHAEYLTSGQGPMYRDDAGSRPSAKPNLDKVLDEQNALKRWSDHAISIARAYPSDTDVDRWPPFLDKLQEALDLMPGG